MLRQIADYWAAQGYAPTVRDIMTGRGSASTDPVASMLRRLRDQGYVTWEPRTNRTLRLTPAGRQVLGE